MLKQDRMAQLSKEKEKYTDNDFFTWVLGITYNLSEPEIKRIISSEQKLSDRVTAILITALGKPKTEIDDDIKNLQTELSKFFIEKSEIQSESQENKSEEKSINDSELKKTSEPEKKEDKKAEEKKEKKDDSPEKPKPVIPKNDRDSRHRVINLAFSSRPSSQQIKGIMDAIDAGLTEEHITDIIKGNYDSGQIEDLITLYKEQW